MCEGNSSYPPGHPFPLYARVSVSHDRQSVAENPDPAKPEPAKPVEHDLNLQEYEKHLRTSPSVS
jgi:hypothetical protein